MGEDDDSPEAGAGGEGVDGEVHGEVLDDPLDGIQGGAAGGSHRRGDGGGGRRRPGGSGGGRW